MPTTHEEKIDLAMRKNAKQAGLITAFRSTVKPGGIRKTIGKDKELKDKTTGRQKKAMVSHGAGDLFSAGKVKGLVCYVPTALSTTLGGDYKTLLRFAPASKIASDPVNKTVAPLRLNERLYTLLCPIAARLTMALLLESVAKMPKQKKKLEPFDIAMGCEDSLRHTPFGVYAFKDMDRLHVEATNARAGK